MNLIHDRKMFFKKIIFYLTFHMPPRTASSYTFQSSCHWRVRSQWGETNNTYTVWEPLFFMANAVDWHCCRMRRPSVSSEMCFLVLFIMMMMHHHIAFLSLSFSLAKKRRFVDLPSLFLPCHISVSLHFSPSLYFCPVPSISLFIAHSLPVYHPPTLHHLHRVFWLFPTIPPSIITQTPTHSVSAQPQSSENMLSFGPSGIFSKLPACVEEKGKHRACLSVCLGLSGCFIPWSDYITVELRKRKVGLRPKVSSTCPSVVNTPTLFKIKLPKGVLCMMP